MGINQFPKQLGRIAEPIAAAAPAATALVLMLQYWTLAVMATIGAVQGANIPIPSRSRADGFSKALFESEFLGAGATPVRL